MATQLARPCAGKPLVHGRSCAAHRGHLAAPVLQANGPSRGVQCRATAPSTVRIAVAGKHLEVTPAINDHAQKKIAAAIEPFKAVIRNVDVRLSVRGGDASRGEKHQKVEVTVQTARFGVVRAEEVQGDLYASIDVAADKVSRNLRKVKEKAVKRGNWPGRGGERGAQSIRADGVLPTEPETEYDVVPSDEEVERAQRHLDLPDSVKRTKVFYLDAMSLDEAVDRLQAVDHDFYIYLDQDSGHVQVFYKRKGGDGHGVTITIPDDVAISQGTAA